ncbi:MAG: ABC transporter ATP-binding protein [Deltaproteobacteria bacterium]|nr:ABC transporter ATP-binding protein [Candidatus Zymogenaceae bacterium]
MTENAVYLRGVQKSFRTGFFIKKTQALSSVSLEIKKGEVFGYLGPNGSGKTTTLKLIMGIIFPDKGIIRVMNRPPGDIVVKESIGFLPESPYFYEYLTAREFLDFYARLFALSSRVRNERIGYLLKLVGLEKKSDIALRLYSKGMLQRVGLAQALINDPDLIILDEPMAGLDPLGRAEFKQIIHSLKSRGKTIIFSSHILPDVEALADRVGIIINGSIRDVGKLDELLGKRVKSMEITVRGGDKTMVDQLSEYAALKRSVDDRYLFTVKKTDDVNKVIDIVRWFNARIETVEPIRVNLEELFISEIKKDVSS